MLIDIQGRLMGSTLDGVTWTPQAITGATSILSENWLDLASAARHIGEGDDLIVRFAIQAALASATLNATVQFQLLQIPTFTAGTPPTISTFTTTGDTDVSAANDTITEPAHGLVDGTRLTVASSGAFPTTTPASAIAANKSVYAVNCTPNTFQVAETPGGAPVDITAATGAGVTLTWTWHPEIIARSGEYGVQSLQAGVAVPVRMNPLLETPFRHPLPRFVFGRMVSTAALTTGSVLADIVLNTHSSNRLRYPPAYTI